MMKKTALLIAVFALISSATAEAQVFVRRGARAPVVYTNVPRGVVAQPSTCCQPATYYAGNPCCQPVVNCGGCGYAASPCCGGGVTYQPVARTAFRGGRSYCVRRGLLGQPTVYVPGQPVRNMFRFLTP